MFPDAKVKNYDYMDTVRLSSPTCEQLGIPNDDQRYPVDPIRNTLIHIDGIRYETLPKSRPDPFSPFSMIPLPSPFGSVFDSSCIRRRNERERDRVRCVNDGYLKLKEHIPLDNKEKRISKVETLRGAIQYIKHLQSILDSGKVDNIVNKTDIKENCEVIKSKHVYIDKTHTLCTSKTDNKCNNRHTSVAHVSDTQIFPTDCRNDEQKVNMNSLQGQTTMRPN